MSIKRKKSLQELMQERAKNPKAQTSAYKEANGKTQAQYVKEAKTRKLLNSGVSSPQIKNDSRAMNAYTGIKTPTSLSENNARNNTVLGEHESFVDKYKRAFETIIARDNTVNPKSTKMIEQTAQNNLKDYTLKDGTGKTVPLTEEQLEYLAKLDRKGRIANTRSEEQFQDAELYALEKRNEKLEENVNKSKDFSKNKLLSGMNQVGGTAVYAGNEFAQNAMTAFNDIMASTNSLLGRDKQNKGVEYSQKLNKTVGKLGTGIESDVVKGVGQAFEGLGQQMPSILLSGGGAIPSGAIVGGVSEFAGTYNEMMAENPQNKDKAILTGLLKGTVAGTMEKVFGGVSSKIYGKGFSAKARAEVLAGIKNRAMRKLAGTGLDISEEMMEEVAENFAGYVIDAVVNDKNVTMEQLYKDLEETTKQTALTTTLMSSLGMGGTSEGELDYVAFQNNVIDKSNITGAQKQEIKNKIDSETSIEDLRQEIKDTMKEGYVTEKSAEKITKIAEELGIEIDSETSIEDVIQKVNEKIEVDQKTEKNAETTEKQGTTIENKPLLKQEQQTTLPKGEMAEIETSQEMAEITKNEQNVEENLTKTAKTEYNNVESEGDINGGEKENDSRRVQGFLELYRTGQENGTRDSEKIYGIKESEKIDKRAVKQELINFANKYYKKQLSKEEQALKQIIEKNGGKVIFYEFGAGNYYQGLADKNTIYIDTKGDETIENIFYHELVHNLRLNGNDIYTQEIKPIIDEIANDELFDGYMVEYVKTLDDLRDIDGLTAEVLAEEVVADYASSLYGNLVANYNIDEEMSTKIRTAMDKVVKNSQDEGSILLPENTLPTKQNEPKLLKATEVDEDIQAFEEETANLDKEQKERSYPSTVIESDFVTEKAKTKAKKVLRDNTYIPISNSESIEKATKTIESTGLDNVYGAFNMKFDNNEKMTLDDLVSAEILIQQYSYRGELDKAQDLIEKVAIVGTELGQMVQALSIIKKSNPLAQLQIAERIIDRLNKQQREKFGKKAKKIELSKDTIKAIKESTMENIEENISKAYAEVGQQLNLTWGEKLDNFRYLAMLGNPKTHFRNIGGNVVMHYLNNLKNQVSGGIQDVYKLFKKKHEKTNTLKRANRDQRQFAKEDAELMKDSIDNQGNKYNDKAKNQITENKRLFDSKAMNLLAKANSFLLDWEDNIALQWAYKDAMQDYMSANNLSSEDLRVQESDDEATIREKTRKLNKAREVAINQALEATFHQYSALANALNELERKGGIAGGVIKGTTPYKRTPINIAKTGVAYSPAGLIKSISYDAIQMKKTIEGVRLDYQEGKITEQQYNEKISKAINKEIDQFSKGLTGSALTAIGVAMAMTGWLKIKAGNEDDEDEFMESLGQQKYSITIGDYNISLDWLSPSAIPLFMGVEMYNSIKRAEEDEDVSILTALMNGTLNSLNPLFETTMLSNVLSTFASYSSDTSGKMGDVLATIALNYVTQYIPSGITNVYKSLDGLKDGDISIKTTTSTKTDTFEKAGDKFWNQVKYRLPVTETYELLKAGAEMVGLNLPEAEDTIFAKLPEKVDSYGQVQYRNDVVTEFANNLLNPATVNDVSDVNSKTTEELTRLNKAVDTNVLPATLDKSFSIDGTSHRMDNHEYAEAQKTYGSAYYDAVNTLMNNTSYKSIKDDEIKAELISDIKSYAREKAKAEYAKNAGIKYESENEMYNTLTAIEKAGGKEKDYFKYVVDTYNMESDSERLEYLNSHYNTKVRNAIYENDVGRYTYVSKGEDEKYKALKAIQKGDVSEGYTLYVQKSKEGAFKGENGATGWKAGSKRNKLYDFLNDKSTGLTNIEKYYIATFEEQAKHLLNQSQRTKLRKYLNENKSQIGEETYNSMINKLNEAEK